MMQIRRYATAILICGCLYVGFVVASGAGINPFSLNWDFAKVGQFGDSFGPLNTLMAAVAAVSAIAAYLSQSTELSHAKKDSELERKRGDRRDFESTFFNLLALLKDTTSEVEVSDQYGRNPVKGRDAIKRLIEEKSLGIDDDLSINQRDYTNAYLANRDDLGHYFRLFYHILKFVDESKIDDRYRYAQILRATISNAEMILLALNCIYGEGAPKLKVLIEKYKMLHNISASDAKSRNLHQLIDIEAFGDRDFYENNFCK